MAEEDDKKRGKAVDPVEQALQTQPQTFLGIGVTPQQAGQAVRRTVQAGGRVVGDVVRSLVAPAQQFSQGLAGTRFVQVPADQAALIRQENERQAQAGVEKPPQDPLKDIETVANQPQQEQLERRGARVGGQVVGVTGRSGRSQIASTAETLRQQALTAINQGNAPEIIRGTRRSFAVPDVIGSGPQGEVTPFDLSPGGFEGNIRLARAGGSAQLASTIEAADARQDETSARIGAQVALAERASQNQQPDLVAQISRLLLSEDLQTQREGRRIASAVSTATRAVKGTGQEVNPIQERFNEILQSLSSADLTEDQQTELLTELEELSAFNIRFGRPFQ